MEQFEQLLTCAICLDRYRNPKLLPCQHSFCMEPCMDGLVDYVRRQVKCPECRAEHRIPYQGVQAFPTNVTLQRFLELHIEITGELPDPTSGQTMERCGVCSEKSYCSLCVHCEKKCCPECKDAHMDILRREITRINSQIRRGLHRLQDALALVEKNTLGLQTNCASVAEEVDEIYRRLSKALKDRTEHLRNEIERYSGTEIRGLIQLKENLELEIANIQSNCDLADAHINENVPWDDAELLDTKELFLRTVEFIRNFEYEAGDYGRRVRFVMAHEPNQLVLHVAGYGELNIKPETGSGGHLGTTGGLAPPGGSPGLMRSKSDHRLASQYRQQEEDRLARNRYVPDYEYDAPEYEAPRNKSRYRSRFMRHRDGEESDGDTRSTVRFSSTPADANPREKVLDTEDAARGPLSGIFRLTDSPRVMKKLQECERAGKRKKEEPAPAQPQAPKPQIQVRKAPTAMAKQVSEDDEISRIKKQNKSSPTQVETVEERQPVPPSPVHTPVRETQEREPDEPTRRTPIARRTSSEAHTPAARSASSDSSTGSESSAGSGIRSTGAPFTAEEMKQKYLSRAPPTPTTTTVSSGPGLTTSSSRESTTTPTSSPRPFQSRFLGAGNRAAPPPPTPAVREEPKKKDEVEDDDDDETTSSSEETESETEEESETEAHPSTPTTAAAPTQERQRSESAMARTDIGPLLARSAEARRGSKEDSPSTRYTSPRGSPSLSSPTSTSASSTPGYTSRIVSSDNEVVDDDATSASSASTDRIVEDNVNALTARDDTGLRDESLSGVDTTVSSDDSSDSSESSDSDSESVETVRATGNVPSNDNNGDLKTPGNVESRDNASSTELNNNKIVDSYENARAPMGNVKYGINGDADAFDGKNGTNEEATVNSTERGNIGPAEVAEKDANSKRRQVDGNGDSIGRQDDDERIDDFLARVVRDYNRSREDFTGVSGIIGSRVENYRDAAIEDSIFDKPEASGDSGVSKNLNNRERVDKVEADSATEVVDPSPEGSEGYAKNSNGHGAGKAEVDSMGLEESGERFLTRIEETEESYDAEEDNPTKGEEARAKVGVEGNAEAPMPESNSDKSDEKLTGTASSDEESTDTETESEESSVREALNGADAEGAGRKGGSDVETQEQRNFIVEKVENLFDDNGWVVADEEAQTGNKQSTIPPSYGPSVDDHPREASVDREETDKTDFYNEDSTRGEESSVGTESESSPGDDLSNDRKTLSSSKIRESGSTIGSNGWLVSEESGSESERATSPIEGIRSSEAASHRTDDNSSLDISRMFLSSDEDSLREELRGNSSRGDSTGSGRGSLSDDQSWVLLGERETDDAGKDRVSDEIVGDSDGRVEDSSSRINGTLPPRENDSGISTGEDNGETSSRNLARTVDVDDDDGAKLVAGASQLRRNKAENGVGTVTRELPSESKDLEEYDRGRTGDREDHDETPMNIPMQMVTTVFCVSVLCYSVLTNLFL